MTTNIILKKIRRLVGGGLLALLVLAACAAPQDPALPLVEPTFDPSEEVMMETESDIPLEPENGDETEASGVTQVAPSGTVNLQELTPVPGTGENIVQPAPGVPDPSARIVSLAVADLAALTDKQVEDISVVSATAVIWADSSLGCPQKGVMYMQVLTSGYLVILEADGVQYPYHTDAKGTVVVLCPGGDPPSVMPSDT